MVDYSQSQLLTSLEHISSLDTIARKKERAQLQKEQKFKEREIKKAHKARDRELNKVKRAQLQEARKNAKELKAKEVAERKA